MQILGKAQKPRTVKVWEVHYLFLSWKKGGDSHSLFTPRLRGTWTSSKTTAHGRMERIVLNYTEPWKTASSWILRLSKAQFGGSRQLPFHSRTLSLRGGIYSHGASEKLSSYPAACPVFPSFRATGKRWKEGRHRLASLSHNRQKRRSNTLSACVDSQPRSHPYLLRKSESVTPANFSWQNLHRTWYLTLLWI